MSQKPESFSQALKNFAKDVKPNALQFSQICFITFLIGAIVSTCKITQALMTGEDENGDNKLDRTEEGEFIVESKLQSTQFLVAFGISKAFANLTVGITSDIFGRKKMFIFGWIMGLFIPIMVIAGSNWETVVASNVFLGIQQGFCWTLAIVYMIDYAGVKNRAFTIGINETVGYIAVAIFNKVGESMVSDEEKNYREGPYWMILGFMIFCLILSIFTVKENRGQVIEEHKNTIKSTQTEKKPLKIQKKVSQEPITETAEAINYDGEIQNKVPKPELQTNDNESDGATNDNSENGIPEKKGLLSKELATAKIVWPDNSTQTHSVFRLTFVQSSFLNTNLMCCNLMGLMINFLTAFAWGIFTKWMKTYGGNDWDKYSKEATANVVLFYAIPKGIFQFFFGFISDRIGRKKIVAIGLSINILALIILAFGGEYAKNQEDSQIVFAVGAFVLGFGTSVMYPNVLAASTENTLPINRASALGTYRFWRDSGYWVGGLILGAIADAANIPLAIGITAIFTFIVVLVWLAFYSDEERLRIKQEQQLQQQIELPQQQEQQQQPDQVQQQS